MPNTVTFYKKGTCVPSYIFGSKTFVFRLRRIITAHHWKKISRVLGQGSIKTKNLLLLVSGPNTEDLIPKLSM